MNTPGPHCPRCGVLLQQDQFAFALITQTQTVAASKIPRSAQTLTPQTYDTLLCPTCASTTFFKE
ncbi:hypothetical protein [Aliivibrio fischeri]|uniref:Uncharacterized protein n=1 Tax=Aliivibrio fischeri TaxID=668 RepID=A0A844P726_ALIFS|nr:hypothetical protein [Aliivibrio fischeri]MUK51140.1 hypothetical protein [Aliivibrio fischeri]